MKALRNSFFFLLMGAAAMGHAQSGLGAKDLDAVRAASRACAQAVATRDWAAYAACFTADGIVQPPNGPALTGAAIRAWADATPPFKDFKFEHDEIDGRGDFAYTHGRFAMTLMIPGIPEMKDLGKFVEVWRKVNGVWKLKSDTFNSNLPAPAAGLSPQDVEAIRAATRASLAASNGRDWSKWVTFFTADVVVQPPNTPALKGRAAVEAWGRAFPSFKDLVLDQEDITGRGDLAYARGRYSMVLMLPGMPEMKDTGHFIELWRKESDGAWRVSADTFNSELPAPNPDLTDADRKAIRDMGDLYVKSTLARDWTPFMTLLADDARFLQPNGPAVVGKAAIRAFVESFPPLATFTSKTDEIDGGNGLAYARGTYTMATGRGAKIPIKDAGGWYWIVRKTGDGWRLTRGGWTSDQPLPAPK